MSINCWVKVVGPVHYNHLICVVCKLTIETQNTSISMCIVTAIESKLITLRNSLRIQVSIDIYVRLSYTVHVLHVVSFFSTFFSFFPIIVIIIIIISFELYFLRVHHVISFMFYCSCVDCVSISAIEFAIDIRPAFGIVSEIKR